MKRKINIKSKDIFNLMKKHRKIYGKLYNIDINNENFILRSTTRSIPYPPFNRKILYFYTLKGLRGLLKRHNIINDKISNIEVKENKILVINPIN